MHYDTVFGFALFSFKIRNIVKKEQIIFYYFVFMLSFICFNMFFLLYKVMLTQDKNHF